MKVFLIPLDQEDHPKRNTRLIGMISKMVRDSQILGVERIPYFDTENETLKYFRFLFYSFNTIFYGINHRKSIDLIVGEGLPFGLIGATLSIFIRKPFLWDTLDGNILAHCQLLDISSMYTKINLLIEKFVGRLAKMIIVTSEIDKQLYYKQNFSYKEKIRVIPSGSNLSVIEKIERYNVLLRQKLRIDPKKKLLIYSGKREYLPNKQASFWINDKLAPVLAEKFNQLQIIITGSGEVPPQIHPNVTFVGHVPDYFEHILASDACLVPYNMNTGISTKLIDYLGCGKPTVTTVNVAMLFPELVDGENVLIARDEKEFIEKTIAVLENPALGEKIGANGRKVIEEHYNMEVIGKLWQEAFESCVKS